jgi:hypothetical protein
MPRQAGKYGRKPFDPTKRRLTLERYLNPRAPMHRAGLPPVPATQDVDRASKVSSWPMYLNDQLGDCLIEGTEVVAPDILRAYRAPYCGPAVRLVTESGKQLTVTRNHLVLTARGFARAHEIQEGDYLLSSDRPQAVAHRVGHDLQHAPARVEDVFQAYRRVTSLPGVERHLVRDAVQFHGDAEFFEGEVDIVDADRLLQHCDVSSGGKPEGKLGLILGRWPAHPLDGGSPLQSHARAVPASLPGRVGSHSPRLAADRGHLLVAEKRRFGLRPYLHATSFKPAPHSGGVDPELVGELLSGLPGLVTKDRVSSVEHFEYSGHVYDLSTSLQWYMAGGVFTHNCTIAGIGHMYGAWSTYGRGTESLFSDDVIQQTYSRVGGYVPGDPDTDDGCNMADVLADARRHGMTDTSGKVHKVAGFAAFGNAADENLLGQVLDVFGSVYVGINCQASIQQEFADEQPWTWTPGEAVEGGHAIALQRRLGSGDAPLEYVTWGALQPATEDFQAHAAEEAWAVVTQDWLSANGTSVEGLDLTQLLADMESV